MWLYHQVFTYTPRPMGHRRDPGCFNCTHDGSKFTVRQRRVSGI